MCSSQDIAARRVYVVKPKKELLDKLIELGESSLIEYIVIPQVVMTEELPFEEYLEGWRSKILTLCKQAFLDELLIEYQFFPEETFIQLFGNETISDKSFDRWWITEEAEYLQIPTNWNPEKSLV